MPHAAFTTPQARSLIDQAHPALSSESKATLDHLDFLEFSNLEQNIKDDVAFLKGKDLVRGDVWGWIVSDVELQTVGERCLQADYRCHSESAETVRYVLATTELASA